MFTQKSLVLGRPASAPGDRRFIAKGVEQVGRPTDGQQTLAPSNDSPIAPNQFSHWIIRTAQNQFPFSAYADAAFAWQQVLNLFPDALVAVLMPNHLHLITHRRQVAKQLSGLMGVISRHQKQSGLWQRIAEPQSIQDGRHLKRTLRYVYLNPCRSELCGDPLEWQWSTYRNVMRASGSSTGSLRMLKLALPEFARKPESAIIRQLHHYVSSDPSVKVTGTEAPRLREFDRGEFLTVAVVEFLAAVMAATHADAKALLEKSATRRAFLRLCHFHGHFDTQLLAKICGITDRSVRRVMLMPEEATLGEIKICLAEKRFRSGLVEAEALRFIRSRVSE